MDSQSISSALAAMSAPEHNSTTTIATNTTTTNNNNNTQPVSVSSSSLLSSRQTTLSEDLVIKDPISQTQEWFNQLNIAWALTEHHASLSTISECKTNRVSLTGTFCKNLLLVDKRGRLFLVVAPEDATVPIHPLRRHLNANRAMSVVPPAVLFDALKLRPGSVTPLAIPNDTLMRVTVVLDQALATAAQPLHFHPLIDTATVALSFDALLHFLNSFDHTPVVVDFVTLSET